MFDIYTSSVILVMWTGETTRNHRRADLLKRLNSEGESGITDLGDNPKSGNSATVIGD